MMIHSVSYEAGIKDHSTPTLNDGFDWLEILKEGCLQKMVWSSEYHSELTTISRVLKRPQNTLPSFTRNSLSKLESTMQENLFKIISNSCNSLVDANFPELDLKFVELTNVSIKLIKSYISIFSLLNWVSKFTKGSKL